MPTFETFSKRLKRAQKGAKPDVYQYDELPEPLRVQVIHIWKDAIGLWGYRTYPDSPNEVWKLIHDILAREMGVFQLARSSDDPCTQCQNYLLAADVLGALSIIELSFRAVDFVVRKWNPYARQEAGLKETPDEAIQELNERFKEHGIGYQYVSGQIVRVDSQLIHSEIVKPALALLQENKFKGASDEFLKAYDHYRAGRNKEAISEALKAFESTMKTICDAHGWSYQSNVTAKPLIDTLFQKNLISQDLASHFAGLRSALESGLPMVRNKLGGHGQGAQPVAVPSYVTAYALHLAAANIVFLVEAHKAFGSKPKKT